MDQWQAILNVGVKFSGALKKEKFLTIPLSCLISEESNWKHGAVYLFPNNMTESAEWIQNVSRKPCVLRTTYISRGRKRANVDASKQHRYEDFSVPAQ